MNPRLIRACALIAVAPLAVAACGADSDSNEQDAEATSAADDSSSTEITVGGPTFTEAAIMVELYRAVLEDAGYSVTVQTADSREVYAPALQRGEIDVVPDYLGGITEYINRDINGPDADPVATADVEGTLDVLQDLGEEFGIVALEPSGATNQDAFFVTEQFASDNGVTTLSGLAGLGEPVVLAATEECPERFTCQVGLEEVYGLTVEEVLPLGFGSPQAKQAVVDGNAVLGLTGTTDGTLPDLGLVLLQDDQNWQPAQNLTPVLAPDLEEESALVEALNRLSDELTTEDLTQLNLRVDQDREKAEDVANDYLEEKGLIG